MEALEKALLAGFGFFVFLLALSSCQRYIKEEEALLEAVNKGRNRQIIMQQQEYWSEE